MMRVHGSLVVASEQNRLDPAETDAMAAAIMDSQQHERFREAREIDLAYSVSGLGRFRCNVFQQRGSVGLVIRVIPTVVPPMDKLGLPPVLNTISDEERGLVLVTGTTGSGKTTTLAAMIDHINNSRAAHIMTIEDPIEYLHRDHYSVINQREVASDTSSFVQALRSALRQDPDVILVGEMRDVETIGTALMAAETGHLVLSTVHTLDATETVNRIVMVFPPHQQRQIRLQLASILKAVISQRLIPRASGQGRVAGAEIMITTPLIRECIGDKDKTHQIREVDRGRHVPVRDADVRPVDLLAPPAEPRVVRRRLALGLKRGRVQAQGPGNRNHRHGARRYGPDNGCRCGPGHYSLRQLELIDSVAPLRQEGV